MCSQDTNIDKQDKVKPKPLKEGQIKVGAMADEAIKNGLKDIELMFKEDKYLNNFKRGQLK